MYTILYAYRGAQHTLATDSLATAHAVAGTLAHALGVRVQVWLADKNLAQYG